MGHLFRVHKGTDMLMAHGTSSTKSAHPSLRVLQHGPGLPCTMREEVKSLYVEAGDVNTHPKITETKLLETAKPATKLPPRQSATVRLREERLRDGLLDDEALRWGIRPQKPPLL